MINVPINEFKEKWKPAYKGEDLYTNGTFHGKIQYEDDTYIVIKLEK